MAVSLGTLVPNSRDWHEKYGYQIFHTSKYTLKTLTWQRPTECSSNTAVKLQCY